jgi:hypothetical protein
MWQFRMKEEQAVSVYYFTHEVTEEMCGMYQKGSLLTERIPYRLSQFCNVPYEEVLGIIKNSLKGFKSIYDEYGMFLVRSTMLGINHQSQLKLWHHTDYSQPLPENTNCASLMEMLMSIIVSIETNADTPEEYVKFS